MIWNMLIIHLLALDIVDWDTYKQIVALKVMAEECGLEKQMCTWKKDFYFHF